MRVGRFHVIRDCDLENGAKMAAEELRDIIRQQVVDVLTEYLERRPRAHGENNTSSAQKKVFVVLFSGRRYPSDAFFEQLNALAADGAEFKIVPSLSFHALRGEWLAAQNLPSSGYLLAPPLSENDLTALGKTADALLIGTLSPQSAAKATAGIEDSIPSFLIRFFLEQGKPVIVAEDSAELRQTAVPPAAPPRLRRLAEDAYHGLSEMGIRFCEPRHLQKAVHEAFYTPINETPERLAKVKPSVSREFITSEDVWKAASQGKRELLVSPNTVITDEARDHARRLGVEILFA